MRRQLWLLAVVMTAGALFLSPGANARGLQIGPIVFPDINPPATIDQSKPTQVRQPEWMPNLDASEGDVVILIPGTTDYDGEDQLNRTRGIGMFGDPPSSAPPVKVVDYPAAFGFTIGDFPIYLAGTGTFNESVDVGTRKGVAAVEAAYDPDKEDQTIVINGYSQSAPVAMNVAYMLKERGIVPEDRILVVVGADSRFPHTGVENVVPSFIPGMYTNGDRNPADTGDIEVISYCVRGDATCGVGNPFTNPVGTFFYLLPGFYVHAFLTYRINEYEIIDKWSSTQTDRGCGCGNTTYVVYDGGNPWGMMLRDLGIPVPKAADAVLSAIIPVPMPGQESTIAGVAVPTPRELQDIIFDALGLKVTVTDPDRNSDVRDDLLTDDTQDDSHEAPPAEATETTTRSDVVTNRVADDSGNRSADHPSRDETEHTPGTADSDQSGDHTTTTDDTHKTGTETGDTGTNDTDAGDTDTSSDSGESTTKKTAGTTDSDTAADSDGSDNSESDGNGSGTGDSGSID